ncbi:Haemolytic domain-containing protein [Mariniphaga anaerophila]|uniref:Haemolytic domain-containing protein n=1 Tax=Mariniphaga anaerophila TaxID=1484053 RepID=A0A1M5CCP6_9BACT|nr:membrane protein insertion efficiency factor YidD [Mariniphaga anaerophila]SHF52523.1 Haemolytic domain-containing protein [Mariniphaga anaerophila]
MKAITITDWINRFLHLRTIVLFIFVHCVFFAAKAQSPDYYGISEIKGLFEAHEHKAPKYKSESNKPKNEFEFLTASSFNVYKAFLSSQDNPSCVFHPSCSEYSVQALQQKGLFLGTLYTFDRLSRCHRFIKNDQYIFDPSKQRYYDPVR